jgi:hypothetical protein
MMMSAELDESEQNSPIRTLLLNAGIFLWGRQADRPFIPDFFQAFARLPGISNLQNSAWYVTVTGEGIPVDYCTIL